MRGIVSFHALDLELFDRLIGPLMVGEKVNPDEFLDAALRVRRAEWHVKRHRRALATLLESLEPPPPAEGTVWQKLRTRLERLDHKADPIALLVAEKVDPDLHLLGRPFLIFEGSAERTSAVVDEYARAAGDASLDSLVLEQLLRLDSRLGAALAPAEITDPVAPLTLRNALLEDLKAIHAAARRARDGLAGAASATDLAQLVLLAVEAHARAVPFWIGRDVDGLETLCEAAGVDAPAILAPAWRPFSAVIEALPALREVLTPSLDGPRAVGAFVAPDDVPELVAFLNAEGARIIQAATRAGEGAKCSTLLRKIRECAHHAKRHGRGYLEASGVLPAWFDPDDDLEGLRTSA
jgi:hypothetical protein